MTYGRRFFGIPSRQLAPYHHMATDWGGPICAPQVAASPCELPSLKEFRIRFPEFKEYPDDSINLALDDAASRVDGSWAGSDCTIAALFLAAHFLAIQAIAASELPVAIQDGSDTTYVANEVTSIAFESMRVGFGGAKGGQGGQSGRIGAEGAFDLTATPYGQRYLDLLQLNKPPVLVV